MLNNTPDKYKTLEMLKEELDLAVSTDDDKRFSEITECKFSLKDENALMSACRQGAIKILNIFLSSGGWSQSLSLFTEPLTFHNALHLACLGKITNGRISPHWEVIELLLKKDIKLCLGRSKGGFYPLTYLWNYDSEKCEKLMSKYGIKLENRKYTIPDQKPVLESCPDMAEILNQGLSLLDRVNALCDAVVNAAQTEFSVNVDLQRAINAGEIASTLSGVQKFLTETSQMYLETGVDFAEQGSLAAKVQNTEKVFKAMMNEINPNTNNPALAGYLGRI